MSYSNSDSVETEPINVFTAGHALCASNEILSLPADYRVNISFINPSHQTLAASRPIVYR